MLRTDDTTVAALARRLRVGWHTLWRAIQQHAAELLDDLARLGGVVTLGVDEHIWKPSRRGHESQAIHAIIATRSVIVHRYDAVDHVRVLEEYGPSST